MINDIWIEYLEKAHGQFNGKYYNMLDEYISLFNKQQIIQKSFLFL